MIQKTVKLPNQKIKEIALNIMTKNSKFTHPHNVVIAIMADEDSHAHQFGVNKIRRGMKDSVIESDNFEDPVLSIKKTLPTVAPV